MYLENLTRYSKLQPDALGELLVGGILVVTSCMKGIRFIITWIILFAFVAYIPATYFLKANVNPLTTIGVECVISVALFTIAYAVFNKGTKFYENAGN